jgi:hypothetical protein
MQAVWKKERLGEAVWVEALQAMFQGNCSFAWIQEVQLR